MIKIELELNLELTGALAQYQAAHLDVLHAVQQGKTTAAATDLGWFPIDKWAAAERLGKISELANRVRATADVLVVIGVGGSNQAARAVIEAFKMHNPECAVVYAGTNLAANYYQRLLAELADKEVVVNVIAKNFATLEPGVGFRIFKPFLEQKYGANYGEHIVVTGTVGSEFEALAAREGYYFMTFPDDIGGRFSALSDVGLFPMAVAGIDIRSVVAGAQGVRAGLQANSTVTNAAYAYASARNYLLEQGQNVEVLAHFEPQLAYLGRWWTQLFAESEGKNDCGLYPVALSYSEDLHSVGQYVQQGQKDLLETFLVVDKPNATLTLQPSGVLDGFDYLSGQDLGTVNKIAEAATIRAHAEVGVPVIKLHVDALTPQTIGELFYFFEYAVYLSGQLLGVNPFDQPGVEAYKELMFTGLKR